MIMVCVKIRKIGQCLTAFIAQPQTCLTARQQLLSWYKPGSKSFYLLYRKYRRAGDSQHGLQPQNKGMGYYFDERESGPIGWSSRVCRLFRHRAHIVHVPG